MSFLLVPAATIALLAANDPVLSLSSAPPGPGIALGRITGTGTVSLPTRPQCSDRLQDADLEQAQVRIIRRPRLERRPALPEEGAAIWAVDRRENGCGVMVMMGDLNDVRPVPISSPEDARRREVDE